MKSAYRFVVLAVVGSLLSGCASTSVLTMERQKAPFDQSVVSSKAAAKKFSKLMVIPPSGTVRGSFEPTILLFEREFLKRDITVISGAITGKVVLEAPGGSEEKKNEAASSLSDLERALIMAKRTGADAILQIGDFSWSSGAKDTRFFVVDAPNQPFREVEQQECASFAAPKGYRIRFPSEELHFSGRFVDVENGEVMATLDVTMPANFILPSDYTATIKYDGQWHSVPVAEEGFRYFEFEYYRDAAGALHSRPIKAKWYDDAKKAVESRIIQVGVERLVSSPRQEESPSK